MAEPEHTTMDGTYSFLAIATHQYMVELSGIEPLTSCVQGRRSPS